MPVPETDNNAFYDCHSYHLEKLDIEIASVAVPVRVVQEMLLGAAKQRNLCSAYQPVDGLEGISLHSREYVRRVVD